MPGVGGQSEDLRHSKAVMVAALAADGAAPRHRGEVGNGGGGGGRFLEAFEDICHTLSTQVRLTDRCLGLHEQPTPSFVCAAQRATSRLATAVDAFKADMCEALAQESTAGGSQHGTSTSPPDMRLSPSLQSWSIGACGSVSYRSGPLAEHLPEVSTTTAGNYYSTEADAFFMSAAFDAIPNERGPIEGHLRGNGASRVALPSMADILRSFQVQVGLLHSYFALHPTPPNGLVEGLGHVIDELNAQLRSGAGAVPGRGALAVAARVDADDNPAVPDEVLPRRRYQMAVQMPRQVSCNSEPFAHRGRDDLGVAADVESKALSEFRGSDGELKGYYLTKRARSSDKLGRKAFEYDPSLGHTEHSFNPTASHHTYSPSLSKSLASHVSRESSRLVDNQKPADAETNDRLTNWDQSPSMVDEGAGRIICPGGSMDPQWNGRLLWDLSVILLVLLDAIILPFQMAYKDGDNPDGFDKTWLWLTTSFFGFDLVLNFFTAYPAGKRELDMPPGMLVTSKFRIAKHYLRTWFSIDFVSTVPWSTMAEAIAPGGGTSSAQMAKLTKVVKFVRFLRLMRMLRLAKLAVIWDRVEARLGSILLVQFIGLFRTMFVLMAICHWNACIWWLIGLPSSLVTQVLSDEAQREWEATPHWTTLVRRHAEGEPPWTWLSRDTADAYLFCVYWTLGVMRTMPAEVQPTNKYERSYVLVFMFFAFSCFAICVAQITQTFFKFSERRRMFNEDMSCVRMYLRSLRTSEQVQAKVKDYLRHTFELRKTYARELNTLTGLPESLQETLKACKLLPNLQLLEVFQPYPPEIIQEVAYEICKVTDKIADEELSTCGSPAKACWILLHGRIQPVQPKRLAREKKNLRVVDEDCLLTREEYDSKLTVIVITCSEVIRIDREKFFSVMDKKFPDQAPSTGRLGRTPSPTPRPRPSWAPFIDEPNPRPSVAGAQYAAIMATTA